MNFSQILIGWYNNKNKTHTKSQSLVSLDGGEGWQHGGLGQWIGWHSILGWGRQGGKPCTLQTREPAIAIIKKINFNIILQRDSIITKLSFQRKINYISNFERYLWI